VRVGLRECGSSGGLSMPPACLAAALDKLCLNSIKYDQHSRVGCSGLAIDVLLACTPCIRGSG